MLPEKKSKLLSMIIGDGYITKANRFEISHGIGQLDFLEWKQRVIFDEFNYLPKITTRTKHLNNKAFINAGFGVSLAKRFNLSTIRNDIYGHSSRKNYIKILENITNVNFLLEVWFGDDSTVRRGMATNYVSSAGLDLCTFDQPLEEQQKIAEWFRSNVGVLPKIKRSFSKRTNKYYLYLSFNQPDSMVIWNKIRKSLLLINSMSHKFRFIEEKYKRSFAYLEYNPSERPRRPKNLKYELDPSFYVDFILSYKRLKSSYKVAELYKIPPTAAKRILKELNVLRTRT